MLGVYSSSSEICLIIIFFSVFKALIRDKTLKWLFGLITPLYNFHDDEWEHIMDISHFNWNDTISFRFSARDTAGNLNYTQYYNFTIGDDIKSQTTISYLSYIGSDVIISSTLFSLNANDDQGSGVSLIKYQINDSAWLDYVGPFDLNGHSFGSYKISYYSIDNAGNIENVHSLIVTLVDPESQSIPNNIPSFIPLSIILIISIYILFATRSIRKHKLRFT